MTEQPKHNSQDAQEQF